LFKKVWLRANNLLIEIPFLYGDLIKVVVNKMKIAFNFIVILVLAIPSIQCSAATLTSNGTGGGAWSDANSWDGIRTPDDMVAGDTLVILEDDVITLSTVASFDGVIHIFGTLLLDNGKLTMDATSSIILESGSSIIAQNSGQNEQITIGLSKITSDQINEIVPPDILTEDTLPVKVIYFRAIEMKETVKLEWATSFEENFDFFTIERSTDGYTYHDYALIYSKTLLSSLTKKYEYIDEMPFPGLSYYRLKATDFDGSYEYHGVVNANLDNIEPDILIYPNPNIKEQITVSYNGEKGSIFRIINIAGKVIENGILLPGLNEITIPSSINSSIYFLQVDGSGSAIVEKFVIR
jgi:hypothetical protein